MWKWGFYGNPQIFPPEGKLGNSKSPSLKILWDYFYLPSRHILNQFLLQLYTDWVITRPLSWPWSSNWFFVQPSTWERHIEETTHIHCTSFLKGFLIYNHYSWHITSQHIFACSSIQLTHCVPSKAVRVMLWAIFWHFWPWFLICKHSYSFCPVTITQSYSSFGLPHFTG